MTTNELIEVLKQHENKRVAVGFLMEQEGKAGIGAGPFVIVEAEGDLVFVPSAFMEKAEEPKKVGMTRELLEKLIPKKHLKPSVTDQIRDGRISPHPCELEKIAGDAQKIKDYIEKHNLMSEINYRSGQTNDAGYFAYAIQAYYQGVLK
jgi:hypothetical protein